MLPADMSLAARLQVTALKTGGQTLDNVGVAIEAERVRAALDEGRWRLWIVTRPGEVVGVALTEVQPREARKVLFVQAAAGMARDAVPALWPMLRQYARNARCDAVQWAGRRGWLRSGVLPDGARFVAEVAELEV